MNVIFGNIRSQGFVKKLGREYLDLIVCCDCEELFFDCFFDFARLGFIGILGCSDQGFFGVYSWEVFRFGEQIQYEIFSWFLQGYRRCFYFGFVVEMSLDGFSGCFICLRFTWVGWERKGGELVEGISEDSFGRGGWESVCKGCF